MLSNEVGHLLRESPGVVDGARWHLVRADDTVFDSNTVIILTERRRLVDDTSTVLCRDVRIVHHAERPVLKLPHIV